MVIEGHFAHLREGKNGRHERGIRVAQRDQGPMQLLVDGIAG